MHNSLVYDNNLRFVPYLRRPVHSNSPENRGEKKFELRSVRFFPQDFFETGDNTKRRKKNRSILPSISKRNLDCDKENCRNLNNLASKSPKNSGNEVLTPLLHKQPRASRKVIINKNFRVLKLSKFSPLCPTNRSNDCKLQLKITPLASSKSKNSMNQGFPLMLHHSSGTLDKGDPLFKAINETVISQQERTKKSYIRVKEEEFPRSCKDSPLKRRSGSLSNPYSTHEQGDRRIRALVAGKVRKGSKKKRIKLGILKLHAPRIDVNLMKENCGINSMITIAG